MTLAFPDKTVQAHLMPGVIIPIQEDFGDALSVSDMLKKDFSLVVSRDEAAHAVGQLYIDDGSDLLDANYERYELVLQKNALTKFVVKEDAKDVGKKMKRLILTNAADLSGVNFACMIDVNRAMSPLKATYDESSKTLVIAPPEDA